MISESTIPASNTPPPPPPTSDFRTAVIKNHWNDPPKKIFHKSTDESSDALNVQAIIAIFSNKLDLCKTSFQSGPQKRIVDDTCRRVEILKNELEKGELSTEVINSLHILSDFLEMKEYSKALGIHTQLMTTEFERHGNWIVGLKRLIDLTEKASA